MDTVGDVLQKIQVVSGAAGWIVQNKSEQILWDNGDFQQLKNIAKMLGKNSISSDMDPNSLILFKNTLITSVEVVLYKNERSFSVLKNVLFDREQNLKVKILKKYFIVVCNQWILLNDCQECYCELTVL